MKSAAIETPPAAKARDKLNINIFMSHDVNHDDGCSDNETALQKNVVSLSIRARVLITIKC